MSAGSVRILCSMAPSRLSFCLYFLHKPTCTFWPGVDRDKHSAEEVHAMKLASLNDEFARIVSTLDVIAALELNNSE